MDNKYYLQTLYPLQDRVLHAINSVDTGFYLTGGTAVSRGYLNHRFSDDLDLFVNDQPLFARWANRIIQTLANNNEWNINVLIQDEYFVRLMLTEGRTQLKIEMINDVPAHVGNIINHPQLGRLDSKENILANKLTAILGREEPKDLADIWGLCCQLNMPIIPAIEGAQSKAAGIFPPDLARALHSVTTADWDVIKWYKGPTAEKFVTDIRALAVSLLKLP
ncbi:MAG TPA: nucleotidyl transferase AbiEii/AbiGii toxin family protein [Anaerolineae bacterium]|nr:nucleotidyl transferase AbiEii/AbiGii toxin family protein [Anaerolineae bacterium]